MAFYEKKNGEYVRVSSGTGSGGSGEPGSAEVTAESIREALGYEPAKQSDVEQLTEDLEDRALKTEIPEVPVQSVNKKTGAVSLNAGDVGADPAGTASGTVSAHNSNEAAHPDIRQEISELSSQIDNLGSGAVTIPDYWQSHIDSKIAAIKALQDEGGKDAFSFIVIADPHYPQNLGKNSGKLARKIMDACDIRYALILGDMQSRAQHSTKADALADWDGIREMFKPIAENVLYQRGNHDGSWGSTLNGVTYPYNFTPEELYNRIHALSYKHHNAATDESGSGYYLDDTSRKVRYILLNTHCNEYEENSDGSAKYSNMKNARFTQSQYDMLVDALNTVPSDSWAVIVAAHVPVNNAYGGAFGDETNVLGDHIIMRKLLTAYKNKAVYSQTWAGTNGYDAVSIDANFTSAKGKFVGYFSGHMHADYVYHATDGWGIDIITVRCDSANENNSSLLAERVAGTVTEQCFDVFTVDRNTGMIYGTRIGAGDDRNVSYSGTAVLRYSVTNTLSNCTNSNGASSVQSGASYTGTITANSGYEMSSINVTMGGTDITSTAVSNGKITIASITGDVVITAVAVEKAAEVYTVTNTLTNCSSSNSATSATAGTAYNATITAADGYTLEGATVSVKMGGTDITSTAYSNGKVTISAVTGTIVIAVSAVEDIAYHNLFDVNGDGFTVETEGSKYLTNWMPYNYADNNNTGTIYHFKGFANDKGYTNPYKMQFKAKTGVVANERPYCTNANQKANIVADYDSSVRLVQHSVNNDTYNYIRFEFREALPANLIITANEQIID